MENKQNELAIISDDLRACGVLTGGESHCERCSRIHDMDRCWRLTIDAADAIDALQLKADNLYHLVRDLNLNEIIDQIGSDSLYSWLKSWQNAADAIYNRKPNGGKP